MKNDCLFCAIAAGEIPSNKVYEDELCYDFHDIAPQAPTHFLVIPKAHIASVSGINAENSAVVAHIFEVIAKVTKEMGIESYRVVSNIGEQAGKGGILYRREYPLWNPKRAQGASPLPPELPALNYFSATVCQYFSSERFGVLLFPLSRCCSAGTSCR